MPYRVVKGYHFQTKVEKGVFGKQQALCTDMCEVIGGCFWITEFCDNLN